MGLQFEGVLGYAWGMKKKDELVLGPAIGEGVYPYIRRKPDDEIETGILGTEDSGDSEGMLQLSHINGCRYEVQEETRFTAKTRPATERYRKGWDNIFGRATIGQA